MPNPDPQRPEVPMTFIQKFTESLEAISRKQGKTQPDWEDAFLALLTFHQTRNTLIDREVNPEGVAQDMNYAIKFGRPRKNLSAEFPNGINDKDQKSIYDEAIDDVTNRLRRFFDAQEAYLGSDEENQTQENPLNILKELIDISVQETDTALDEQDQIKNAFLSALKEHLDINDDAELMAELNDLLEQKTAKEKNNEFIKKLREFILMEMTVNNNDLLDPKTEIKLILFEDALQTLYNVGVPQRDIQSLRDTLDRLDETKKSFATEEKVLETLKAFELQLAQMRSETSPYRLTQMILQKNDDFQQYLMHRNGEIAPEGYTPAYRMPPAALIRAAVKTYDKIEQERQTEVELRHLLPELLSDSGLQILLGESGLKNVGELYRKVHKTLFPVDDSEERFRHKIHIAPEFVNFLHTVTPTIAAEERPYQTTAIFLELLKNKNVKEIVQQAGLTDEHLEKLPDIIEESKKEHKDEDNDEIGPTKLKVSDAQFEELIETYARDLTKEALEGKLDPITGRDTEIDQVQTILLQRNRRNPALIGDPGVGKTAIASGLAQAIVSGDVADDLIGQKLYEVDMGGIASNPMAMYRGGIENIVRPLIEGAGERDCILFIDELHAAMQVGVASGTPGISELLKTHLTRKGKFRVIGATTWDEWVKDIAPNQALARRFQTVTIDQPSVEQTIQILQTLKKEFEQHHKLSVSDEIIDLIPRLTERYLHEKKQPDKSIMLLDAACARSRMAGLKSLSKEHSYDVVAEDAKLDPDILKETEARKFLRIKEDLPKAVLDQDHATITIANAIIRAKADLGDPSKPIGSFLLLGPTGVGKTETGRALSRILNGTEDAFTRIDMSDYQDAHAKSRLVGAPPGYIGHGEEGELTGAARKNPWGVIMLDEIEKAHSDILYTLLPVMEEGELVDGKGRTANFKNIILLMSSNLGAAQAIQAAQELGLDPEQNPKEWENVTKSVYISALEQRLPPEFRNRLNAELCYNPLGKDSITKLVEREISTINARLKNRWGMELQLDNTSRDFLADQGYSPIFGARPLKRACEAYISDPLAQWLLESADSLPKPGIIRIQNLQNGFAPAVSAKEKGPEPEKFDR